MTLYKNDSMCRKHLVYIKKFSHIKGNKGMGGVGGDEVKPLELKLIENTKIFKIISIYKHQLPV